ncbi:hypothetical protein G5I_01786 [Acromyrmex echinatior]|uniref:Uncharacterized protein n=1 Tax=Acromyrmex echinatior TaxID=103372 RepID=F4W8K5_ACREC|nr:hypothetical protein G5I_01786 [Acromyrmex echinatior]
MPASNPGMRVCACFTSAPRMFADSKLCRTMPAEPLSLADYKTRKNVKSPRMPFCRPVMEIVDTLTSPYPANWNTPLFLPKLHDKTFDCVSNFELVVGVPLRSRVGRRSEIPRDNAFIVPRNPITPDAGAATLLGGHRDIAMDTREETRRRRRCRRGDRDDGVRFVRFFIPKTEFSVAGPEVVNQAA